MVATRGDASARKIVGRVEDAFTLEAVPEAQVVLLDGEKELSRARADKNGRFALSGSGDRLHVQVHAAEYREATEIVPAWDRALVIDMHEGSRIRGRVVDDLTGAPVKATVACLYQLTREVDPVATDAGGNFVLPHCGSSIAVRAAGYAAETTRWGSVTDGDELATTVRLERGAPVDGRVIDEDGKPVPGADVLVFFSKINMFLGASAWAKTGPDGRFAIPSLGHGDRLFLAFRSHGPIAIENRDVSGPTHVELVLPRPFRLSGHVKEANGAPAKGAKVTAGWYLDDPFASQLDSVRAVLRVAEGIGGRQDREETVTDARGAFQFPDVWSIPIYLQAEGVSGRGTAPAKPGDDAVMTLSSGGGAIAGTVVDSNGALVEADGELMLFPMRMAIKPGEQIQGIGAENAVQAGRFRVDGISAGMWSVSATLDRSITQAQPHEVKAGQTSEIQILADRNGRVHGRVVDELSGEPVPNTCVDAAYRSPPSKASPFGFGSGAPCVRTNRRGQFRIDNVRGAVTLHLTRGTTERPWPFQERDAKLDVPFGQDVDAGTLTLARTQRLFPR